ELRTPLAAVRGHAELALHRGADARHALTRIEAEARRMSTIVDDLLLLARLDAGRPLESVDVDLTLLVLNAVDDAQAVDHGDTSDTLHRWRLDLPTDPVVVPGDPHRLAQAVANLVANARVHTPPGTRITVGIAPRGDSVRLTVEDTGPGLPA